MIYLLAILWFASGFSGCVYWWTHAPHIMGKGRGLDFKFPSVEFLIAMCWGLGGPLAWIVAFFLVNSKGIVTLFKARNK